VADFGLFFFFASSSDTFQIGRPVYSGEIKGEQEKKKKLVVNSASGDQFDGAAAFDSSTSDLAAPGTGFVAGTMPAYQSPIDPAMTAMGGSASMVNPNISAPALAHGLPAMRPDQFGVHGGAMPIPADYMHTNIPGTVGSNGWQAVHAGDGGEPWAGSYHPGYPGIPVISGIPNYEAPQDHQVQDEREYNFDKELQAANTDDF